MLDQLWFSIMMRNTVLMAWPPLGVLVGVLVAVGMVVGVLVLVGALGVGVSVGVGADKLPAEKWSIFQLFPPSQPSSPTFPAGTGELSV
jgi:hypothetical protein